jgi:deoxyadenosine/deoxycytidine kinase
MVHIISIEGIIGAGKTSLLNNLKDQFTCFQEPVKEWSLLNNFYSDMKAYAAPLQFQILFSFHRLYSSFKNIENKIILERCPWSSKNIFTEMLFDKGYIEPESYNLYCNFYDKVAFTTDSILYLQVDTDVAYRRILVRDRDSERALTFEYLDDLNRKYNATLKALNNVKVIDANRPLTEIYSEVVQILNTL